MNQARLDQEIEAQARRERELLVLRFGRALNFLVEHPNSRLSLMDWTRKVTEYRGHGFLDFRDPRMSPERIVASIEDAREWWKHMEKGKVVKE